MESLRNPHNIADPLDENLVPEGAFGGTPTFPSLSSCRHRDSPEVFDFWARLTQTGMTGLLSSLVVAHGMETLIVGQSWIALEIDLGPWRWKAEVYVGRKRNGTQP